MRRKFSFFTVFMCLFFCFSSFVTASDEPSIIKGQVVCEDDIVISGIEIYIDRYESDGESAVGTAVGSVKTDENGYFSFKDPGGSYFGCGIKKSSLPYGYGSKKLIITSKSDFYKENGMLFELASIADAHIYYSNGGLTFSFYDSKGDIIYCDFEKYDTPADNYESITYEELKNLTKIHYEGQIYASGKPFDWSGDDVIASDSIDSKIGYLRNKDLISEDKYYDLLLDYIEDDYDGAEFFCGNPIMSLKNKIREYANQTENTALRERIIKLLGTSDEFGFGEIITEAQEDESEWALTERTVNDKPAVLKKSPLFLIIPCIFLFVIGGICGIVFWKKHIKF